MTTNKEIIKILGEFGLSDNEARVYLAMLKSGENSISYVAKEAKLNRVTTHHIIERLEERGYAVSFGKKTKKVKALHPNTLKNRITESTSLLGGIIPDLISFMPTNNTEKPEIKVYYGVTGFEKAAEVLLDRPNTTIRHIGSIKEAHKFIGLEYDLGYFIPKRLSKNISYKMISPDGEDKALLKNSHSEDLREVKKLPDKFKMVGNTFIVPGKVVLVTSKNELVSIVIESKDISQSESEKFDLIWELLS